MKKVVTFAFFLLLSFSARADVTEFNKTIANVGVQGLAYVVISPPLSPPPVAPATISTPCLWGVVYLKDVSTPLGKAHYATVLTGYALGKPLARIDYVQDAGGTCYATLVAI
jgi:hypothetical protein